MFNFLLIVLKNSYHSNRRSFSDDRKTRNRLKSLPQYLVFKNQFCKSLKLKSIKRVN